MQHATLQASNLNIVKIVENILKENEVLVQQIKRNHSNQTPESLKQNNELICKLDANINRVTSVKKK